MSANFLLNQYPFSNPFIFNKNNFATPQMPNVFDGFNFNCSFANAFSASAFDFSNFNFKASVFSSSATSTTQTSESQSVPSGKCKPNAKLDKAFLDKVKQIAARLNCDYRDLLGVMNAESGLNSKAVNSKSGATGLIQFMPSTAKSLGTSTAALKNMSAIQQLDYVEKFFVNNIKAKGLTGKRLTSGDIYALVFMPAKVNKDVICKAGSKEYSANKGLDTNKDGIVTKTELGNRVIAKRVDESIFTA